MSRNLKLFLGSAVLFYLAGVMNEAPALFVMSGAGVACIFGCYIMSRLAVSVLRLHIEARSTSTWADRETELDLDLSNIGLIPRPAVPVLVELTNLTVDIPATRHLFPMPALPARQTAQARASVVPPCRGEYTIASPRLLGSDPLGMFHRLGPAVPPISFLALPMPIAISREELTAMLAEHTQLHSGIHQERRGDFIGVRPHEETDELRQVHWKLAAHTGELMVKQYTRGRDHNVALWLDTRADSTIGTGAESSFECQVTAAATLIQAMTDCGLALKLFGDGLPPVLRSPDRGQSTYHRWLTALARIRPDGRRSFAANIAEWTTQVRAGTTVFALTSGLEAEAVGRLRTLTGRGVGVRALLCGTADTSERLRREQLRAQAALHWAGVPAALADGIPALPEALADLAAMQVSRPDQGVRA